MSVLTKPYEISVWDDIWDITLNRFKEYRLGVIGSNEMTYQGRAQNPLLTRNVNGVKKMSFTMYKYFVDNETGEKVENPYIDWLVSERKVKLKYDGEWYDFIVKNIIENSTNYEYTYQLEDALVQELSKNGFNVVFDEKVIDNTGMSNIGSAKELCEKALSETNWTVSSEVFIEKIEEALVYLQTTTDIYPKQVIDQTNKTAGLSTISRKIPKHSTVLGFYSSCTSKPHRFQFIYVSGISASEKTLSVDENNVIIEPNCQYYLEFSDPESQYILNDYYDFYLPTGFQTSGGGWNPINNADSTVSAWYRGARYGFAQQKKYIRALDRYVGLYKNGETLYYGYEKTKYCSPALTQNLISNSEFGSGSGWVGTYLHSLGADTTDAAQVEPVYGRWSGSDFVTSVSDLESGQFENYKNSYTAYLKMSGKSNNSIVLNTGPFDNRSIIENMEKGSEWGLYYKCYQIKAGKKTEASLTVNLEEYVYSPATYGYTNDTTNFQTQAFSSKKVGDITIYTTKVTKCKYSDELFKNNSQVRLAITVPSGGTYYLEKICLFKVAYTSDGTIILPEEQGSTLEDRVIDKTYYYFTPQKVANITNAEQLIPDEVEKTLTYTKYVPVYNENGEKIRSIKSKESNYFNILQTIAETFEAWVLLETDRDSYGAIENKRVALKNYIGKDNCVGFKYGVNLKDIQRTYESKNIVTKLIVQQNKNEYGEDGFCTIARASANPTGENSILDFQYFHARGLLDAMNYINTLYSLDSAFGPDLSVFEQYEVRYSSSTIKPSKNPSQDSSLWSQNVSKDSKYYALLNLNKQWEIRAINEYNLQGYLPRIKALNNVLRSENSLLDNILQDLTHYNAQLEVAKSGEEAAKTGIEETRATFQALTGYQYEDLGRLTQSQLSELYKHSSVQKTITEYSEYTTKYYKFKAEREMYENKTSVIQESHDAKQQYINSLIAHKSELNKLFFQKYSRFIQEGTWIDEKYMDDNSYYSDALSVMYNSCYPQVAYNINVLALSKLPGYEEFSFELGDKTYAEDVEFFGSDRKEEVILTEISNYLNDPSKDSIKVQNFKNQFQDLFQKITATVQTAQYRTGAYEKAVALAEAKKERKMVFLKDALDAASARLAAAGQQSVTWGNDGITVRSVDSPSDAIRMVGGAILLSKQDQHGQQKWVTGVTSDGVSANLITAGVLNAGEIAIMDANNPLFKWDSYGITAFNYLDYDGVSSAVNSNRFIRFDQYGIYGINGQDGYIWKADSAEDAEKAATFSLTWEGFKTNVIKKNNGVDIKTATVKIGKDDNDIIRISRYDNTTEKPVFQVTNEGTGIIAGWTFNDEKMYKTFGEIGAKNSYEVFLKSAMVDKASESIVIGVNNNSKNVFSVMADGSLKVGPGAVGDSGWQGLYIDGSGNIRMTGNILWGENSSHLVAQVYNSSAATPPPNNTIYELFPENKNSSLYNGWHTKFDASSDKYTSTTSNAGKTWGPAIKIVGDDGADGADAALDRADLLKLLNGDDGIYNNNGKISIKFTNAAGNSIMIGDSNGYSFYASGSSNNVEIGGWIANQECFTNSSGSVKLTTKGITADSFKIANWTIGTNIAYAGSGVDIGPSAFSVIRSGDNTKVWAAWQDVAQIVNMMNKYKYANLETKLIRLNRLLLNYQSIYKTCKETGDWQDLS